MATYPSFMTVEEFEHYPFGEMHAELVRGEPRVSPPRDAVYGVVQSNVMLQLLLHAKSDKNGRVFSGGLGYQLTAFPNTVRDPNVSFIRADRIRLPVEEGFMKVVPDLVALILSPSDTALELEEKLEDYQTAGTPLIWVIHPERRSVRTISLDAPARLLHANDTLDGGGLIPRFSCPVSALFEGLAP